MTTVMRSSVCSNVVCRTKSFIKKYFLEGQKLEDKQRTALETLPSDAPFLTRLVVQHRRLIGERGLLNTTRNFLQ